VVHNWRCKSCIAPVKSSSPTNQHPTFLQAWRPSCRPINGIGTLEGKFFVQTWSDFRSALPIGRQHLQSCGVVGIFLRCVLDGGDRRKFGVEFITWSTVVRCSSMPRRPGRHGTTLPVPQVQQYETGTEGGRRRRSLLCIVRRRRLRRDNWELCLGTHRGTGAHIMFCSGTFQGPTFIFEVKVQKPHQLLLRNVVPYWCLLHI